MKLINLLLVDEINKFIIICGLKTLYAHQAPKPDPLQFHVLQVVALEHRCDVLDEGLRI